MVRHNCEIQVLTAMREALARAYDMLNTEGASNTERLHYWRGRIEGIEEGIRVFQHHSNCPNTSIGPRFIA